MAGLSSDQLSRNRETTTGESGLPEPEHKRPRLSDAGTNMDAETSHSLLPSAPSPTSIEHKASLSPMSKVTINTRPLSAQSSTRFDPTSAAGVDQEDARKTSHSSDTRSESPVMINVSDVDSVKASGDVNEPISIPSSPDGSVVRLDDATTSRTPSGRVGRQRSDASKKGLPSYIQRISLWQTFPYLENTAPNDVLGVLQKLSMLFERHDENFVDTFMSVNNWLSQTLAIIDELSPSQITRDQQIWSQLPHFMAGLLKRNVEFPVEVSRQDFMDILKSFLQLTIRLVQVDIQRLQTAREGQDTDISRLMCSTNWLQMVSIFMLPGNDAGFLGVSQMVHGLDANASASQLAEHLAKQDGPRLLVLLANLLDTIVAGTSATSLSRAEIVRIISCFQVVTQTCALSRSALGSDEITKFTKATSHFFTKAQEVFHEGIVKQHPWLTIDNSPGFVEQFCRLMISAAALDSKVFDDVFKLARVPQLELQELERSEIACCVYKLTIFRIFVQHGRMELRVYAIENMAQEMVNIWQATTRTRTYRHALIETVVAFLRGNGIVKYIFGIDPHPQIVQRSTNVIGFLCVSGHWKPEDTDLAWQAVLDSHDGRAVAAFYEILRINLTHLDPTALLYMCKKMSEVEFDSIDNRMLEFIQAFVADSLRQPHQASIEAADMKLAILNLCFRLLQQSHTPSRCDSDIARKIRRDINQLFQSESGYVGNLLLDGMDASNKLSVLESLCRDILDRTDLGSGSILAMNCILVAADRNTAQEFVRTCDYTNILVSSIVHNEEQTGTQKSESSRAIEYDIRLSALSTLVVRTPESFTEDMARSIWDNILASDLPHSIRARAWNGFADAFKQSSADNLLLQSFVRLLMDSLPPSQMDRAVLRFVEESIKFDTRPAVNAALRGDREVDIPGQDRLWRILLEAPPRTVEDAASDCLIQLFLDNSIVSKQSVECIDKTHTLFIDKCVQILLDSSQAANEGSLQNRSKPSNDISTTPEIKFQRVLKLLGRFISGIKSRPRYKMAATVSVAAWFEGFVPKGEPVEYNAIISGHPDIRNERYTWKIGNSNTGGDIYDFLSNLTGWDRLNIICGGLRLGAEHLPKLVGELLSGRRGPITISKALGATEKPFNRATRAPTLVDSKVLRHFKELYKLLEAEDVIAKAVLDFMTTFSWDENVVTAIRSMSMSPDELFPTSKPFKMLYHAATLRSCIEEESFATSPDTTFVQFVIRNVLATLPDLHTIEADQPTRARLIQDVLTSFLFALRTKSPREAYTQLSQQPNDLVAVLLAIWRDIRNLSTTIKGQHRLWPLYWMPLEVFIEALLLCPNMWDHVEKDREFAEQMKQAILLSELSECRNGVLECISQLTGTSTNKTALKANDPRSPRSRFSAEDIENCLKHLWIILHPLVEDCWSWGTQCQEYLQAMHAILSIVGESLDSTNLLDVFHTSISTLLKRARDDTMGYQTYDMVLQGLAKTASHCLRLCDKKGTKVSGRRRLIDRIFNSLLFPPLSAVEEATTKTQSIPVLDGEARSSLYGLLLDLANSNECYLQICSELEEDLVDQNAFALSLSNEKAALQSDQGYSGLKNLGTTCYLNSLFVQLFMNVKFRKLIFESPVIDVGKQALLSQMAATFAAMQSSFEKSISPEGAVESIVQYDGEPIDVTVQMDVDEFFNLLFDRLESQIVDDQARKALKAVYGGQLVQQIKSKECEHVSERLEPFSTVQIEIKGKHGLEEGLQAYVEGEVLQGDNKYSCTGCGRHVDAVKRACLKEIPDNLIFNLKRFDYDIMTGMRAKVNDEFQFPDVIDMAPYTIETLSNETGTPSPDVFELVGVIIHTGTAETGHYYSYVRQRPSTNNKRDSWITFNDTDVTKFNIDELREQAFGGYDTSFGDMLKMWNGYMLFYQRSSSIEACTQEYHNAVSKAPLQVQLPQRLDAVMSLKNEVFLRNYISQDPSHAKFLRNFFEKVCPDGISCSAEHGLEQRATEIVLNYAYEISSRWKEAPEFEEMIKLLGTAARHCRPCALGILTWFATDSRLTDCLIKAFYNFSRKQFAELFYICCSVLWPILGELAPGVSTNNLGVSKKQISNAVETCLMNIVSNWSLLQKFSRSWDTLLPLLTQIARLGYHEAHALIEAGVLAKTTELVWVHHLPKSKATPSSIKHDYMTYIQLRDKNRPFPHQHALDLFAELLLHVRLSDDRRGTLENENRLDTSREEQQLLGLDSTPFNFGWLRKMIISQVNPHAVASVMIELSHYPKLYNVLTNIISQGLSSETALTAHLYLMPALHFIQHAYDSEKAHTIVHEVMLMHGFGDGSFAAEQLDALQELKRIRVTTSGLTSDYIAQVLLTAISNWAPQLLLAHNEPSRDIRGDTRLFLNDILIEDCIQAGIEEVRASPDTLQVIRNLAQGCTTMSARTILAAQQGRTTTFQTDHFLEITNVMQECATFLKDDNADDEATISEMNRVIGQLALLGRTMSETAGDWREDSSDQLSEMESYDGGSS